MSLSTFLQNPNGINQPSPAGILPTPGPFGAQYQRSDIAFDYAVAGIPFIGGESLRGSYFRRVYQRSFSPIRKDQFDNEQVPGEQSIWGWWLRSQSNFSLGAGTQFLDTTTDQTLSQRFSYSEGLDMLGTPGQVTLLPVCVDQGGTLSTIGPVKLRTVTKGGVDGVLVLDTGARTLKYTNIQGTITNYTMPAGIGSQTIMNTFTDDGSNYYLMTSAGIYKGSIANNGVAATVIWNPPTGTSFFGTLNWVKGRLVAGWTSYNAGANVAASVYELVGAGPALPTPKFTHQNPDYVFTDVSEIGPAILVSGHALGNVSQVHRFTLDSGGAMPTLTSGAVALQMPYGEKILSMYAYIGYFVGLGTNRGFRVATADSNGNLVYGPLVFQDPNGVGVQAISGYDRFMFTGNQGNTMIPQQGWVNPSEASTTDMLIRVDLSTLTSTNSQPFANDLQSPTTATGSPVNSIAPMGQTGLLVWASGAKTFVNQGPGGPGGNYQNATRVTSGFMYTPKIRYNTLEPKHFKYVYARHQNITGAAGLDIYGITPQTSAPVIIALNIVGSSTAGAAMPFGIGDLGNAQEWFQLKFVLHNGNFTNLVFNGYQMRALPGVSRQVMIEVPFLCLDHETDRNGVLHGYDGYAFQRVQALENIAASGNVVLFQDLNYNINNLVVVDDYKFEQQSPELAKTSSSGNQDSNAHGGYIILNCRVIS